MTIDRLLPTAYCRLPTAYCVHLPQERILLPFSSDRGRWPVATIHGDVITQRENLFTNASEQGVHVTTGQVRTANAVLEEHITRDHEAMRFAENRYMAWRMARNEEDLQLLVAEVDQVARASARSSGRRGRSGRPLQ